MIALIASVVGEKAAKPVFFGILALVLVIAGFTVAKCSGGDNAAQRQAEQTTASGDAFANAASNAVETISNRVVDDKAIDAATANVSEQINHAQDPDTIRSAVLNGVCGQASHRNDPACAVR